MKTRSAYLAMFKSWLGYSEHLAGSKSHMKIVDIYNSHKPLPRGYMVRKNDNWCATTVSAAAIATDMADLFPIECSCGKMIEKAKKMGIWVEKDSYVPKPGDIILYDWDDNGSGDCTGWPEHVGAVVSVSNNTIHVIEGNKNDEVGYRDIKVNARYIRGFITPRYAAEKTVQYITTGNLYLREDADKASKDIVVIPKGTEVTYLGKSVKNNGITWLKVKVTIKGKEYTGWASKKYLEA